MKKLYASPNYLKAGEKFIKVPFIVRILEEGLFFADCKGKVKGTVAKNKAIELENGKIYLITGSIMPLGGELNLYITEAAEASDSDYEPIDIYGALPDEKVIEYKKEIITLIGNIKHPGYQELVRRCLTEETLERFSKISVPEETWGNYYGAPLAATCQVSYMACGSANSFAKRGNGISHKEINQSLLLTAGLLHEYARIQYVDENNADRKSLMGVTINYFALLVLMLERVRATLNEGLLTDDEFSILINALEVSVTRSATCCISREGMVLRSVISLYHEIDAYDWQVTIKPVETGEVYYYSTKVDCYIVGGDSNGE